MDHCLTTAGLFAGIGGFELGMVKAGHVVSMLCENAPAAQAVLTEHFSNVDLAKDIRFLHALPSNVNVVTAGFPCQDLSSVGNKAGIDGPKSSLVGEALRLLNTDQIEWVIFENVPFMLHLDKGRAMLSIITSLEEMGYAWAYRTLDALHFGLPQRRRRVFILASRRHCPRSVLLTDNFPVATEPEPTIDVPLGFYYTEGAYAHGLTVDAIPTLKAGSSIGIPSPPAILIDGQAVTPDIRDAERLQGFPVDWTLPAERVAKPAQRWTLVGNSLNVAVAEWLGHAIAISKHTKEQVMPIPIQDRWPAAAYGSNGQRFAMPINGSPITMARPSLRNFFRYPVKKLSERAIKGFLNRAAKGKLHYPCGFLESLTNQIEK